MPAREGQKLAHYILQSQIGRGGMGVVWKAHDTVLDRIVAVKVLPPDHPVSEEQRRKFFEEAKRAASMSHAHIVQIYEFGQEAALDFIVMEHIEGQPLNKILHGRPLPADKTALWGLQIAKGLARAHRQGLLHRDLKPGNILITRDGDVKIVDFGLATLFEPRQMLIDSQISTRSLPADEVSTSVAGTLPYMSPEQLKGEVLDARSDIFSLGVVLYEMTTGQRPFVGARLADVATEIRKCHPTPVHELVKTVPLELDRIVTKALARRRSNRYQTMDDLAVDLEQLQRDLDSGSAPKYDEILPHPPPPKRIPRLALQVLVGLLSALFVVVGAKMIVDLINKPPEPTPIPTPVQDYFTRGLHYMENHESLRNIDDGIQMFHRALEQQPDFAEGWAHLGSAYWIRYQYYTHDDGSRREAEEAVSRAFELQAGSRATQYAMARGFMALDSLTAARQLLENIVNDHPNRSEAWAALGEVHRRMKNYTEGLQAFQKAIALKPEYYRYHLQLGYFYDRFSEYDAAAAAYEQAVEIRPDSRMGWGNLGTAYLRIDRPEKAVKAFTHSLDLEESAAARSNLGTAYYFLEMYEEAAKHYMRATLLDPGNGGYWANLADALKVVGKPQTHALYEAAVRLAQERVALRPNDAQAHISLGLYCARAGSKECAEREVQIATDMESQDAVLVFRAAIICAILGQEREALDWLERAVKLGISKAQIENDPDLHSLDQEPRYQRILDLAS